MNKLFFDICIELTGCPNPKEAKHTIQFISLLDSNNIERILCFSHKVANEFNNVDVDILVLESETAMIQKFFEIVNNNYTLLIGYNIKNFDIPFLMKRCENLSITNTLNDDIKIFDMFENIKESQRFIDFDSFDLVYVVNQLFGFGKDEISKIPTVKLYRMLYDRLF